MFQATPRIGYSLSCSSAHRRKALQRANDVLSQQFICLSRIREPLGSVGGYWNMDPDIVFCVAAGSLNTVISGIERMRDFLARVQATPEISDRTSAEIMTFLQRSSVWVRCNRIDDSQAQYSLSDLPNSAELDFGELLALEPA
ncbi:hypothetical protein GGF46_005032 [Coemansia sp. RSA 552]|nr:hypothetical protein GGF46_005032 [Coemansia sp. RSA 552]